MPTLPIANEINELIAVAKSGRTVFWSCLLFVKGKIITKYIDVSFALGNIITSVSEDLCSVQGPLEWGVLQYSLSNLLNFNNYLCA